MFDSKRVLTILVIIAMLAASASAAGNIDVSVVDANGNTAAITAFTKDGVQSWWAELPEESAFDQLRIELNGGENTNFSVPAEKAISVPDAGSAAEDAAWVTVVCYDAEKASEKEIRIYVSHEPYKAAEQPSYKMRAVGRWAYVSRKASIHSKPGQEGERLGTLESGVRVYVLYICRVKGIEYSCIRIGDETCFINSESLRQLSDGVSLSFDTQMLSERSNTAGLHFARTAYSANLRSALGNTASTVVEVAPENTLVLVMSEVSMNRVPYSLVYRLDTKLVGFVHSSQLAALTEDEAVNMLSGTEQSGAARVGEAIHDTALLAYPLKNAQNVIALSAGTPMTVFADIETPDGLFYLIAVGQEIGYATATDIRCNEVDVVQSAEIAEVIAKMTDAIYGSNYEISVNEALIYNEPAYDAAATARVAAGERLTVTEQHDGWLKVSIPGIAEGWLPSVFAQPMRLTYSSEDGSIE
ncbi:MAG: hypothetical protein II879_03655 [Clostridia bacterium]|nr:hypothetical protein [Clostridia bacterium]